MNNPKNFIALMVVFVCCFALFPSKHLANVLSISKFEIIFYVFIRLLFSIFPFIVYCALEKDNFSNLWKTGWVLVLLYFVVCVNNFPFMSLFQRKLSFSNSFSILFSLILNCISVAVFEELIFRGIIICLLLKIFTDKKYQVFWSILISSTIFGSIHIINLFSGQSVFSVLLSVGYSFLTGAMFAITFLVTKKLFWSVLLHFVYNFCGSFSEFGLIVGEYWTVLQIIFTFFVALIVSIVTIVYFIVYFRRKNESGCSES